VDGSGRTPIGVVSTPPNLHLAHSLARSARPNSENLAMPARKRVGQRSSHSLPTARVLTFVYDSLKRFRGVYCLEG
jgi:hypothetical protein